MKRLPQTLTAAALTGALAFGGAAVAQAQIGDPMSVTKDGEEYIRQDDNGGSTYIYDKRDEDGNLVERKAISVEEARQIRDAELGNDNAGTTDGEADTDGSNDSENASEDQKLPEGIPAPATKEDSQGKTWYQSMKDPAVYVNDPALVNVEITDEMREAYAKAFPSEEAKPEFDKKKLAWLALPAALVIGGITWYLSQDGKTYVKDEARKNQEPTVEEKAASEQMLNANKDEVIAQGGQLAEGGAAPAAGKSAGAARGMSAETGSNTVARGLVGLAVAAMVAAAAFAARRKFFA
ncbi:TPA: hypothetical protein NJT28_001570 [Corynebacterium striatum]|nr:hypothetical protein [Corynebacterium striatum]